MLSQSVRQSCNPVFLGNRNFTEDKNSSRPLDRSTGEVTVKILHSLDAQLTGNTNQQSTASLCPSTVNLAICPDTAQQLPVQEEPFLSSYTFNHIHSFRSFMKFRCCGTLSTINTRILPAMHIWIPGYNQNCLLDVVVLAKSSSLSCPLLSNSSSG